MKDIKVGEPLHSKCIIKRPRSYPSWILRMEKDDFHKCQAQQKQYIIFLDGASKDNLGVPSARGVVYNPEEHQELTYAWGLGETINNQVEALAVYQGPKLLRSGRVRNLIVIGIL